MAGFFPSLPGFFDDRGYFAYRHPRPDGGGHQARLVRSPISATFVKQQREAPRVLTGRACSRA